MKKFTLATAAFAASVSAAQAVDLSDGIVKIGVLNDQSGTYSDFGGKGSVAATEIAIAEFDPESKGMKVELVSADHQNKTDIASAIARKWYEAEQVDAITDLTSSAVAIAINGMARDMSKITLMTGPGSTALTNKECSPTGFHWGWDTYSQSVSSALALLDQGYKSWFILTSDYAFGHQMEADLTRVVNENGGQVLGSVKHPLSTMDFSSFLLQAQASGAQLIALANGGADTVNSIKQAADFGITASGQALAGMVVVMSDITALGLQNAQGLTFATSYYWDRDDRSRAFAEKFLEKTGTMPGMIHAATYSAVLHYLKSVEAAGTDETQAVVAKMREMPVSDDFTQNGSIRPDGRMITDMYLVKVKTPAESTGEWDYLEILSTIPAEQTAAPLEQSACPFVKQ
ncbi:ABC transporter substrate-binding protein [Paracoccus sp. (in: a-proteobacteria)]|uniref:ABC transporter substrate-binding protein n=1 Tax=Paracoccus sp. TaxID=267 RepID=UPI003A83C626